MRFQQIGQDESTRMSICSLICILPLLVISK
jgi:hypothetical protein